MTHHRISRAPSSRTALDDDIRRLLQAAGRRPPVPKTDLAIVKATARREWEKLVAPRRRRRIRPLLPLAAAASLVLALALAWRWGAELAPPATHPVATIELLRGDVWLEEPAEAGGLEEGDFAVGGSLAAGSELVTGRGVGGASAHVAIRLLGGHSVRLQNDSRLRLTSSTKLELVQGAVYVDSAEEDASIEVATPYGRVLDVGTQFEVRLGAEDDSEPLRVMVRTGSVTLVRAGIELVAAAGEKLALRRDGSVERGTVPAYHSSWDWVLATSPNLDIEGISLATFLDWVARETGLAVRYEDPALSSSAPSIVLHGTIEGLRPDEAITVVLPGSGLDYEIEAGELLVRRPSSG